MNIVFNIPLEQEILGFLVRAGWLFKYVYLQIFRSSAAIGLPYEI